jgi:UDP-N-acetylmuramate--alanine ligase
MTFDLSVPRRIHVLGASGPGMGAIARILARMGHRVSGCDVRDTAALRGLADDGVAVLVGNDPGHVDGVDAVTHSSVIPTTHSEIEAIRATGGAALVRADMLAAICSTRSAIGVAGTHGKTTTSALLASILVTAGVDPGWVIGGDVPTLGSNAHWGDGEFLVVEADESDSTHLRLPLAGAIVTNVDVDHLDNFGSFEGVVASFATFVEGVHGPVVLCAEDPTCAALASRTNATTFGIGVGDVQADGLCPEGLGSSFEVSVDGRTHRATIALPGRHNVLNALAALAMAVRLGVPAAVAIEGLAQFGGVSRRFDVKGDVGGVVFVDDYAHLPAEIAATLAAARVGLEPRGRLVAVFQPNRYHRIAAMAADYAGCFGDADVVVIADIYGSGTEKIPGVSGRLVADSVAATGAVVHWCEERGALASFVDTLLRDGDVCVSMGCGDIESLPDEIMGMRTVER